MNRALIPSLLTLAALVLVAGAPSAAATGGRIVGVVVDADGEPIEGALVLVKAREVDIQSQEETNRKGKFSIQLLDASRTYDIRIEKEGYLPIEEPVAPPPGSILRKTWVLRSLEDAKDELAAIDEHNKTAAIYNEGTEAYNRGDVERALELFAAAAAQAPDLAEPWAAMARLRLEREEWSQALEAARKLNALAPDNAVAIRFLHDALWGLGEVEEAATVRERLIAVDPSPATAARVYNAGVMALREDRIDDAMASFQRAIEIDSELVPAHSTIAQIHASRGHNDEALASAARVLELDPDNSRALSVQLAAYRNMGRVDEAEAVFARLQEQDPDALVESYFQEGQAYFNQNRQAEATAAFERVLEVQPDHASGHYMLGLCRLQAGDMEGAKALLTRFLELEPEHPEAGAAREMLEAL